MKFLGAGMDKGEKLGQEGSGCDLGWNLDVTMGCRSVHLLHKEKQIKPTLAN